MRINDQLNVNLNKLKEASDKKKAAKSESSEKDTSAGSDTVSLSSSAKDVAAVKDAVKGSPDIRVELVSELRVKIESGQYNVSGKEVAEKIVQAAIDGLF